MSDVKYNKEEFIDDVENALKLLSKRGDEERKGKEKTIESNLKHLYYRSKELKKEIPAQLHAMAATMYPFYISYEFYKEYEEWLKD